jgi:drug/metabolite transporter (DMT)-like permease
VVITAVIMRKAPSALSIVGCGVIACGALAITAARGGGESLGIALALLGALTFAVFVTVLAEALRDGNPVELALVVALAAGATSGALALVDEGLQGFAITPAELTIIAFGAVGSGAIPTLVRAWSLPEIGPPVVGALGVLAPVMTVLLSMVLLDAGRSPLAMLGVLAIAAGAAVAALAPLLSARRAA